MSSPQWVSSEAEADESLEKRKIGAHQLIVDQGWHEQRMASMC
jgi:hypothetical protein